MSATSLRHVRDTCVEEVQGAKQRGRAFDRIRGRFQNSSRQGQEYALGHQSPGTLPVKFEQNSTHTVVGARVICATLTSHLQSFASSHTFTLHPDLHTCMQSRLAPSTTKPDKHRPDDDKDSGAYPQTDRHIRLQTHHAKQTSSSAAACHQPSYWPLPAIHLCAVAGACCSTTAKTCVRVCNEHLTSNAQTNSSKSNHACKAFVGAFALLSFRRYR